MPVLPSAAVGALLCVLVVFVYERSGFAALSLLVVVLFVFQYLLRELLLSQERAERLASLQLGRADHVIETLALRDRMTARHSRRGGALRRRDGVALGRPAPDQELVHTAGLLHDIGKFAFPDHILLGGQPLHRGEWEIVRTPPR